MFAATPWLLLRHHDSTDTAQKRARSDLKEGVAERVFLWREEGLAPLSARPLITAVSAVRVTFRAADMVLARALGCLLFIPAGDHRLLLSKAIFTACSAFMALGALIDGIAVPQVRLCLRCCCCFSYC